MTGVAVIYNQEKISVDKLRAALAKAELIADLVPSGGNNDSYQVSLDLIAKGYRHIVASGGDGTLRRVIQAIAETGEDVRFGMVPTGTGNILARNLGIPIGNIDKALKVAIVGTSHQIDLGWADVEFENGDRKQLYFSSMAGLGVDAIMMEKTESGLKKRIGWVAYIEGGLKSLPIKFLKFKISVDDAHARELKVFTLMIGNAGVLPGNVTVMPDAKLDDGFLDVAAIGPRRLWNWIDLFARLTWQNRLLRRASLGRKWLDATADIKTLEHLNGKSIRITPLQPTRCQLDGDPIGSVVDVRFVVSPAKLNVIH